MARNIQIQKQDQNGQYNTQVGGNQIHGFNMNFLLIPLLIVGLGGIAWAFVWGVNKAQQTPQSLPPSPSIEVPQSSSNKP
ncbi:MAG: cbb3-type cytochrome oxidase assembly protein [Symploca sp. SIO2G7]|nr:cbb3-type cytochrome oxidase assembly protein [Symploca sp. SIO2G7]